MSDEEKIKELRQSVARINRGLAESSRILKGLPDLIRKSTESHKRLMDQFADFMKDSDSGEEWKDCDP